MLLANVLGLNEPKCVNYLKIVKTSEALPHKDTEIINFYSSYFIKRCGILYRETVLGLGERYSTKKNMVLRFKSYCSVKNRIFLAPLRIKDWKLMQ